MIAPALSHTDTPLPFFKGNHTGYKQFKGTRTTADEISELYAGLKQSHLTDFDVLLSGYAPSAEAVAAVGAIARDLKREAAGKPGSFFWGELYSTLPYLTLGMTMLNEEGEIE